VHLCTITNKSGIMGQEHIENLFLQEKPTLALLAIWSFQKTYASVIAKEINSTFAHTTKILTKMEEAGLIQSNMQGRIKFVELTVHGHEVVDALKNLILVIENKENLVHKEIEDEKSKAETKNKSLLDVKNDDSVIDKTLKGKINDLSVKIDDIYNDLAEQNVDDETIARKLGPFKRDVKILEDQLNTHYNNTHTKNEKDSLLKIKQRLDNIIANEN